MPEVVIENDIDAEVSNEEAHRRYAAAAVAFAVDQHAELFDAQTVSNQRQALGAMQAYTADYLEPFNQMKLLEDNGGVQIPWIERGNCKPIPRLAMKDEHFLWKANVHWGIFVAKVPNFS